MYNTKDRLQTSITLQDGCFGTATLMRIAALFMAAPTPPTPLPPAPPVSAKPVAKPASNTKDSEAAALLGVGVNDADTAADHAKQAVSHSVGLAQNSTTEYVQPSLPQGDVAEVGHTDSKDAMAAGTRLMPLADFPSTTSGDTTSSELAGSLADSHARGLWEKQQDTVEHNLASSSKQVLASGSHSSKSPSDEVLPSTGTSSNSSMQPPPPPPVADLLHAAGMPSGALPAKQQGLQTAIGLGTIHQEDQPTASFADAAMNMLGAQSATHTATDTVPLQQATAPTESTDKQSATAIDSSEDYEGMSAKSTENAKPAQKRCEQFSLEIVRCKTVCPAQVSSSSFTSGNSPLDHTLYMEVLHFLLQLPIEQPAQHPRPHPVNLNVRHVLTGQHPAVPGPDAVAPSPFAVDQQQGTICALTNLALFVALPEDFESVNPSHAQSMLQLPPLLSIPTASLLAVGPRPPPFNPSLRHGLPSDPVLTLELEMKVAELIAKPAQLQTMSASTIRYSTEMDTILGITADGATAPASAATPVSSPETEQTKAAPNSPAPQPGCAIEASVGLISLHLHSSNKHRPALVLQWQRLSGHYAWAASPLQALDIPTFTPLACGLSWHYLSLQLANDPVGHKPQLSLENLGSLRSGSLLVPSRLSRAQSDPAVVHMGRAGSTHSSRPSSARHIQARSTQGSRQGRSSLNLTRAASPEQEYLQHQHSLSRLHVAPVGNTRGMGLNGLTALAAIAADDNESVPESVHCIFNNRARLSSDGFAEALEAVLPSSLSATSVNPGQPHAGSDTASSSGGQSRGRSHGQPHGHDLPRLMSGGASVASSHISIDQLQRQVPVIRHRPLFMASIPSEDPAMASYATASSDLGHLSGSLHSTQGFQEFYDAPEKLNSPAGNWSPDVDKLPAGDRLLLLLGSKETLAPSNACAHPNAALNASAGCILQLDDTNASAMLALEVCATDMLLRIYLEVRVSQMPTFYPAHILQHLSSCVEQDNLQFILPGLDSLEAARHPQIGCYLCSASSMCCCALRHC